MKLVRNRAVPAGRQFTILQPRLNVAVRAFPLTAAFSRWLTAQFLPTYVAAILPQVSY